MDYNENVIKEWSEAVNDDHIFFKPKIPPKRLNNAINKYALDVNPQDVLILVDNSAFGSAKAGLLVTQERFYAHSSGGDPVSIAKEEINIIDIRRKMGTSTVRVNNDAFIGLIQPDKDNIEKLCEILNNIYSCDAEGPFLDESISKETTLEVEDIGDSKPDNIKIAGGITDNVDPIKRKLSPIHKWVGGFIVLCILLSIYAIFIKDSSVPEVENKSNISAKHDSKRTDYAVTKRTAKVVFNHGIDSLQFGLEFFTYANYNFTTETNRFVTKYINELVGFVLSSIVWFFEVLLNVFVFYIPAVFIILYGIILTVIGAILTPVIWFWNLIFY